MKETVETVLRRELQRRPEYGEEVLPVHVPAELAVADLRHVRAGDHRPARARARAGAADDRLRARAPAARRRARPAARAARGDGREREEEGGAADGGRPVAGEKGRRRQGRERAADDAQRDRQVDARPGAEPGGSRTRPRSTSTDERRGRHRTRHVRPYPGPSGFDLASRLARAGARREGRLDPRGARRRRRCSAEHERRVPVGDAAARAGRRSRRSSATRSSGSSSPPARPRVTAKEALFPELEGAAVFTRPCLARATLALEMRQPGRADRRRDRRQLLRPRPAEHRLALERRRRAGLRPAREGDGVDGAERVLDRLAARPLPQGVPAALPRQGAAGAVRRPQLRPRRRLAERRAVGRAAAGRLHGLGVAPVGRPPRLRVVPRGEAPRGDDADDRLQPRRPRPGCAGGGALAEEPGGRRALAAA